MTILDIVDRYPQTEAVFRKYDRQAGVCLCCQALFNSLHETAEKYNLSLEILLDNLKAAISSTEEKPTPRESLPGTRVDAPSFNPEK